MITLLITGWLSCSAICWRLMRGPLKFGRDEAIDIIVFSAFGPFALPAIILEVLDK